MKARELAKPYPAVGLNDGAVDAARLLIEQDRPGLIVVDEHSHPVAVLGGSRVLRLLIPGYIQDDPNLTGVVPDDFVEHMCDQLEGKTVAELLPKERITLPVVASGDSVLKVAALMSAERSPIVAVVDGTGKTAPMTGAITLRAVLEVLLPERITDP